MRRTTRLTLYTRIQQCTRMSSPVQTCDTKPEDDAPERPPAINVRLPVDMIAAIDAKQARMAEAAPGVAITRSDAVRALLSVALDRERA